MTILNKTSEIILLAQIFGGILLNRYTVTESKYRYPTVRFLSDHKEDMINSSAVKFLRLIDPKIYAHATEYVTDTFRYESSYQVKIYTEDL